MKNKIERVKKFKNFSVLINEKKNRIVNLMGDATKLNDKTGSIVRFGEVRGILYQSDIDDHLINLSITDNYQNLDGTINTNFYISPYYSSNLLENDNLIYKNNRLFLCPLDTYLNKIEAETDSKGIVGKSLKFGCVGSSIQKVNMISKKKWFRYVFFVILMFSILILFRLLINQVVLI